jgi:transposase
MLALLCSYEDQKKKNELINEQIKKEMEERARHLEENKGEDAFDRYMEA